MDFSKSFSTGAKSGEIWFLPLEIKKPAFFAEIFKFLPPFRHPCLCVGKVCATPLKIGVISTVLTQFQMVKFYWILYAKWNIWQINFNCVFVFALATLNGYILFRHWQHNWHLYGRSVASRGASGCPPISRLAPRSLHTSNTVFLKCAPPLLLNPGDGPALRTTC